MEADDVVEEAQRKAARLRAALQDVVSEVIPVSAPMALVARNAPDSFLEQLLELSTESRHASELNKALRRDNRWDRDEHRASIRRNYPIPWVSFVRIMKLLMEKSCGSVVDARNMCLETSGFKQLESILDERFFKRAALIKQRITRVKAQQPLKRGVLFFNERIELFQNDEMHFRDLVAQTPAESPHSVWLQEKALLAEQKRCELEEYAVNADRARLAEEDRMDLMEKDLEFLDQMNNEPDLIESRDQECIQRLLASNHDANNLVPIPEEVLQAMISRYQHELQGPIKRKRNLFEHLIRRFTETIGTADSPQTDIATPMIH